MSEPSPHIAFDELIDQALDTAARSQSGLTDAEAVRDTLGDPAKRDVVTAWLRSVGFRIGGT